MLQPKRELEPADQELLKRSVPPAELDNPFLDDGRSHEDRLRDAGVVTLASRVWANRALNAVSIGAPLAGAVFALATLQSSPPSVITAAVFVVFFLINAFGISIGLHRYFTHRSFRPAPWFAVCLAVAGSWAFQGPIGRWVADHRRHHRFSDSQFDPHSPYWTDESQTGGKAAGWLHAHFLWMLTGKPSCEKRYAKDIHANSIEAWFSNAYWLVAASGLIAPAAVGYLFGGAREALSCFLWAGCVRVSLLHQITWSVNSFGHMIGDKVDGSRDESRDNRLLAILLIGEGLHSYHHRYPLSAINEPIGFDASGATLKFLSKLGVVDLGGVGSKA